MSGTRDETGPGTDQPPIGDYGIIGDCRTAALVSRDGSIDWYCLPRFDGPSVFGALLDTLRGGSFRVAPTSDYTVTRRYLPETNVLETTFRTDRGTLVLTDAMTVPEAPEAGLFPDHEILRRAECVDGEVEVEMLFDPRFDYGRRIDDGVDRGPLGIFFDRGESGVVLRTDLDVRKREHDPGWTGRSVLRAGERRYFSVTSELAAPTVLCPLGTAADQRLEHTARWWRDWLTTCPYEGDYADIVFRSMLVLKLLMFPPSGAILAAPTTSLPEAKGGSRNWDYRYCWLRDASMTLETLLDMGFAPEAEAFMGWLLHATRLTRPRLQILYDVHGRTRHDERELPELAGYRGARPVRIGNAASGQRQLDTYGEVIRAAWSFVEQGAELDRAESSLLADLGETVCELWHEPDNGVWEVRGERRHYTHSKALCWVALDCLAKLAADGHVDPKRSQQALREEMAAIRESIDSEGWSEELQSHVAWYGSRHVDASLLLLGITGYVDPAGERMERTRRTIRERLGRGGGLLRRYSYDDGLPGREGAFGIASFLESRLLALQGRVDEARERFEAAVGYANDLGLLAEEVDPETGALLGNFPQAYTHIGLLSAASEIDRALGRSPSPDAARPKTTEAEAEWSM